MVHLRTVETIAFLRDDGLWDLQATLTDRKTQTFPGGARDHEAGTPIHGMSLTCTVDRGGAVLAARAQMDDVPFEVSCPAAQADYAVLVGLNLFQRFRAGLRERLGERSGCAHLSMLAETLPTLAIQAFAGVVEPVRDDGSFTEAPAALDRCRGLRRDGEAVRLCWPRWHVIQTTR
jgi:hypothetical protein